MTSTSEADSVFVWVWLPEATIPVVAGRIRRSGSRYEFAYGRSYLADPAAISLYSAELPLREGWIEPVGALDIASCLRDAGPDSWGQRVVMARLGMQGRDADPGDVDQLTYFLESGSNRIGGLDFQAGPTDYVARGTTSSLDAMHAAADALQEGEPIDPVLADALLRGTSIGGARPKVLLEHDGAEMIAKFSATSDPYPVVKAEAVGFELARRVGVDTPASWVTSSLGKDVLIVERFDRPSGRGRRLMVSGLTMLGLAEHEARYATYPDLLEVLRRDGADDAVATRLFERIVLNIAIGNNDDHARNHAAFWDGRALQLTPAYDLCPQIRSGEVSAQAMAIGYDGERDSSFRTCLDAAGVYGLSRPQARDIIDRQVDSIRAEWDAAADAAGLTRYERELMLGRQILNPYAFYGYEP